jgi:hypothetical protein
MSDKNNKPTNEKKQYGKKRYWGFIAYPESVPENWVELLTQTGLPIAISPLHDKDLEANKEANKKPHWHVILCYSGPQTFNAVKTITDKLNSPNPIPLDNVRGNYHYLIHKDNPEKYQYDAKDIRHLNGFSVLDFAELTKSEVNKTKKQLLETIIKNELFEYSDFINFVMFNGNEAEFDVASSHTIFFNTYITSHRHATSGFPSGGGK